MFLFFFIFLFYLIFIFFNYLMLIVLNNKMSVSVFESGFDGVMLNQNSVSVHFFLIMVLFVIFDLELVLFIGFLLLDFSCFFYFFLFFFFVMLSFYLEFMLGKLLWCF